MRIAIVSDIHANLEALEAVLEHIDKQKVDQIACLGDIVGYGPNPKECWEIIHDRVKEAELEVMTAEQRWLGFVRKMYPSVLKPILRGNHEEGIINPEYLAEVLGDRAREVLTWTIQQLRPEQIQAMRQLPYSVAMQNTKRTILLTHGDWSQPDRFRYLDWEAFELAGYNLQLIDPNSVIFCGNTHRAGMFTESGWMIPPLGRDQEYGIKETKAIVNVSSIGQPRIQGDTCATYVIYDTEKDTVTFHRIVYRYSATIEKIMKLPSVISRETKNSLARNLSGKLER